mgnify:CR=1 FL=1
MSDATRAETAASTPYDLEAHYQELEQKITSAGIPADLGRVRAAFECADRAHSGQKRRDGSPYVSHCIAAAIITAEMGLDEDSIIAALLHDTIEDTSLTHDDIARSFGSSVADIVEGVTKLTRVQYTSVEEQQMENMRKMLLAMAKDIRVILIKMADRLHNMRTMAYQSEEKQRIKSLETMEIYAPIAHRLGMQKIKWELEDLSLLYLDPDGYRAITDALEARMPTLEKFMDEMRTQIRERLELDGVHATISSRIKHIYSIYRKMYAQKLDINGIFDLCAFRVIVDTIPDCYNVLGIIHDMYKPLPGRFKDYISTPKPNMYQSVHTTVIGSEGIPFEVQIRTWEMHQTAEYGVAAHWKYKQHAGEGSEKEFEWVRRLLENQQDVEADDYIHSLKVDMFDDEVFVFTPKGKVISLPAGSTPIDFAYAIHSAVGNSMIGAKVNNRIASYDAPLHNGDIVEILTSKSAKGPSRDWLNICQSNQARIKIKQWFKREKRDENIVRGKTSFDAELRHIGVDPDLIQNDDVLPLVLKKVSFECLDDMYAAIGYGGLTAAKAVGRIRDDLTKASRSLAPKPLMRQETPAVNASGVIVEDIGSCMIKFSRCCTPVPGDEIIGFITKGYGVSVHRKDCPNAKSAQDPAQKGRWVKVTWAETPDALFSTSLEIEADDRDGLMLDVATILTSLRLRTSEMSARSVGGGTAIVCLRFGVHNLTELENVRTRLRGISGVHNVERGTE